MPAPLPRRALVIVALLGAWPTAGSGQEAELEGVGWERGDPEAPVVIVEYADFACSACAIFARESWPTVERELLDKGLVRWRFVPFELGFRNSEEGARAGECAGLQGEFWPMHDLLYARQESWSEERNPEEALTEVARDAGLDLEAFRRCYDDESGEERTKAANRAARTDRIRATPTFFIDGFRVQGALPPDAFLTMVRSSLTSGGGSGR